MLTRTIALLRSRLLPVLGLLLAAAFSAQAATDSIRIHYHRPDGAYNGWTVYSYDDSA